MFQIVAFDTVQATAHTEAEAEAKRAKFQQAIDDSYRGGEPCRVSIQRLTGEPDAPAACAYDRNGELY